VITQDEQLTAETVNINADGSFKIDNLAPGKYQIRVRGYADSFKEAGFQEVIVGSADVTGVVVESASKISGISGVFRKQGDSELDYSLILPEFTPEDPVSESTIPEPKNDFVQKNGAFTIDLDSYPACYDITVIPRHPRAANWFPDKILYGG
jgi:hypothetical protein